MTESNSEITQSISGGNSKRKSLEKIIKSWMGRKAGKETITVSSMLGIPSSNIKMVPEANSESIGKKKFNGSSSSLNSLQHKLWNVVPKLKRESSCASLYQTKKNEVSSLRKCETMMALTNSTIVFEPIKPVNRLRNSATIITCSRCSSLLSLTATGSRYSLNFTNGYVAIGNTDNKIKCSRMPIQRTTSNVIYSCASKHNNYEPIRSGSFQEEVPLPEVLDPILVTDTPISELIVCKLCLGEFCHSKLFTISQCGCYFCDECMASYVAFEIMEGAYEISCPDALCPTQGIITLDEINKLVESQLIEKHKKYRLNREVELDKNRTWCPRAGCETVCLIDSSRSENGHSSTFNPQLSFAVQCPTCLEEFCSGCKKLWHPQTTCEENTRRLQANGQDDSIAFSFDTDLIKYCPMCSVPIEKDEGCAQMMCKRCKHVFCWYCLASLDDDFLLRHYDKGPCKNKLGHSRASVVWHRAQVIGIFAGFGILLLVASPLLLLAAPCIVCCKCRICSGTAKLEETDGEFDDGVTLKNKL